MGDSANLEAHGGINMLENKLPDSKDKSGSEKNMESSYVTDDLEGSMSTVMSTM